MTHSLTAAAEALLHPKRLHSVTELSTAPTLILQEGGVYAWWFSKAPPEVPVNDTAIHEGRRLLYVGIAPRKPSATGSTSSRTLKHRLLTHCRGPIASSTLRRTLAVLLMNELDLHVTQTVARKLKMTAAEETNPMDGSECASCVASQCDAMGIGRPSDPHDTAAFEHPRICRSLRQGALGHAVTRRPGPVMSGKPDPATRVPSMSSWPIGINLIANGKTAWSDH